MKTQSLSIVTLIVMMLVLGGCVAETPSPAPPATPAGQATATPQQTTPPQTPTGQTATEQTENSLANARWELVSLGPEGAAAPVLPDSTITLEFDAGGQAGGEGGCNSYGGSYSVEDGTLTFGEIARTLVACVDPEITEQETQYLDALGAAGRFEVTDDSLTLWYNEGNGVLNFVGAPATPSEAPPEPTPESTASEELSSDGRTQEDRADSHDTAQRIRFAADETGAEIDATIAERDVDYYVLHAQQGQIMSVEITSPNNDVLLTVVGEDGIPLKRYQVGDPSWTSELPATQDYYIHAVSVGPATSYTLRVEIEPLATDPAERVTFEPGVTSATRSGTLEGGEFKQYVLAASANQRMHIQTVGYDAPVRFTIRAPGGDVWTGEQFGAGVYIFATEIVLPVSGDYLVMLSVPSDADTTRYDVSFTIDDTAPAPTPFPTQPPERVHFAPGATSAQRDGLLPTGPGDQSFVLAADAGQTLHVEVTSDGVSLNFVIIGPDGTHWPATTTETADGYRAATTITLPEGGDYHVTLTKEEHSPSTNYVVTFAIE